MQSTKPSRVLSNPPSALKLILEQPKSAFLDDLRLFYRHSRSPFIYCQRISGRDIDLHELFIAVISLGGYKVVCENNLWNSIAKTIGLSPNCANNGIVLRRIYFKSLGAYERDRLPFLSDRFLEKLLVDSGQDIAVISKHIIPTNFESTIGIAFSQRPDAISNNTLICPNSCVQDSEPFNGRYKIQENPIIRTLHSSVIAPWNLAVYNQPSESSNSLSGNLELKQLTEFQMIEFALLSGLENEIDLALNSLLILSSSDGTSRINHSIRLSHSPNLLQLLMASVGLFDDSPTSLIQCDYFHKNNNFQSFWSSLIPSNEGRQFLNQDAFLDPLILSKNSLLSEDYADIDQLFAPALKLEESLRAGSSGSCLRFIQGSVEERLEFSRIMLIATILVNLTTPPVQSSSSGRSPYHGEGSQDDEDDLPYEHAASIHPGNDRRSRTLCASFINNKSSNVALRYSAVPPLSRTRDNARFISSSPTALRFCFLSAYSRHSGLKQLGLQLLSVLQFPLRPQLAPKNGLSNDEFWSTPWAITCVTEKFDSEGRIVSNGCRLDKLSLQFVSRCILSSEDRSELITGQLNGFELHLMLKRKKLTLVLSIAVGLSMLSNLSRVSEAANAQPILDELPMELWSRLPQILCLPDLGLVCAALEALLGLTALGYELCLRLWEAKISEDSFSSSQTYITLINSIIAIINMEGQIMGAGSLHRIKLLQRIPPPPTTSINLPPLPMQHMLQQHHSSNPPLLMNSQSQQQMNKVNRIQTTVSPSLIGLLSSPTSHESYQGPKSPPSNEISDRLQMPPPSLPPPSLLRKSQKQAQTVSTAPRSSCQTSMMQLTNGHQNSTYQFVNGSISNLTGQKRQMEQNSGHYVSPKKVHESPLETQVIEETKCNKLPNGLCNGQLNGGCAPPSIESDDSNDSLEDFVVNNKKSKSEKHNGSSSDGKKCNGSDSGSSSTVSSQDSGVLDSHLEPLDEDLEDESDSDYDEDLHDDDGIYSYSDSEIEEYAQMAELLGPDSPNSSCSGGMRRMSATAGKFLCEWGPECHASFDQLTDISAHVYSFHLKSNDSDDTSHRKRFQCQWHDCPSSQMPRAKFALISHVLDYHCQEAELDTRRRIRFGLENNTKNNSVSIAANHDASGWSVLRTVELRRQQNEFWVPHMNPVQYGRLIGKNHPVVPPVLPPREGPVTKHLRVTAALVLQNLCYHLPQARRWLNRETAMLCEIAFGSSPSAGATSGNGGCMLKTNDASSIIARCLQLAQKSVQDTTAI